MGTLSNSESTRNLMRSEYMALQSAISYAAMKHAGQVDKGGEPYLWHALRVGISLLPDVDAAVLGILHDVLEDTDATIEEIEQFFNSDLDFLADLDALTHRKELETYSEYLKRVEARPRAKKVKIADISDNLNERRLDRAALKAGPGFAASSKLKYELALSTLGESKVITFCTDMTP